MSEQFSSFGLLLTAMLLVGVIGAALARVVRPFRVVETGRVGFPAPKWAGPELAVAFALQILIQVIAFAILEEWNFFRWWHGPDLEDDRSADVLKGVWVSVLTFPIWLVAIFAILRISSEAGPSDVGLYRRGWANDIRSGYGGWLVWMPASFLIFLAISLLWRVLSGGEPERHPITEIWSHSGTSGRILIGLQITVVAPVMEEILCRGLVLSYAMSSISRSRTISHVAIWIACWQVVNGPAGESGDWMGMLAPVGFIVLLSGWHAWQFSTGQSPAPTHGIVATAIFFAAMHSNVWPTPVPLFVLGFGLGAIAVRTGGITAAIVTHSLFNAVTGLFLLIGGQP